uniref:Zinc finger, RAN-binding domain containing 3 n=1 Tax=Xiphophorus couchianus TaxID=32473 RepID=A0A3B5MV26_9TELE
MDESDPQKSDCDTRWVQQLSGLPPKLLQRLMPFQREGVEFMGLGKTVQAIAVACAYRAEWPLLVVVPSSLKYPWIDELERWIPELQPGDVNLVESKRKLYTTSRVVRDIINIILKLFMQIDALYPKRFGTWTDYTKKYCNAHYRYFGPRRQWDCRGASNLEELHQRLSQIMIRRLKAEVLSQLPPKIRQRIPFDLPKEAAKEASACFAEWERLMKGLGSRVAATENPFTEVMSLVTQMYKQTAIAKAGAVKDYIKMVLEAEQLKFLVFAHHLTMLQACTEAAIEAKAGYIRIDGSVPSSERIKLVHKFQSDPETRVAILSIQAAGQGLTFTAASHVVFAELYWNPGHMKQAEDRAHRIGQTSSVNVHYLIAKGTFDTVMWSMLNRKETVTGSTLNGRKEYLKADEGDKDKWEFLSIANSWTPSEMVLPLEGNTGNVNDDIFFSYFEKEKQHDIRSFFSPSASKEKRKKPDDGEPSPSPSSEPVEEVDSDRSPSCVNLDQDFSPQLKRLRTPKSRSSPGSRFAGKRRLMPGWNSPGSPTSIVRRKPQKTWSCGACTYSNSGLLPYCEMCEFPRSSGLKPGKTENSSCLPADCGAVSCSSSAADANGGDEGNDEGDAAAAQLVYPGLKFCASQYTDRIYLYSKDGAPLNLSFIPLDIKLTNWDDLPQAFSQHRENRIQVLRFVQEWSGLAAMKQKLLRRSAFLFHSPTLGLQQLAANQRPHSSTNRYLSREEVAEASLSKAREEGGGVRVVTKENFFTKRKSGYSQTSSCKAEVEHPSSEPSYLQAVDSQGVPLCLSCQQACPTTGGAWDTRFCSHRCQEEFQLRSSQTFMRSCVLEAEQGICQHCGLKAHELFLKVRDAPASKRKEMLKNTWLAQLPLKQLNEMIRAPVEGDFWQVDHIRPVYRGGGQCSMDNLQTLCTACHKARTAQQARERSQMKKSAAASKVASDINSRPLYLPSFQP